MKKILLIGVLLVASLYGIINERQLIPTEKKYEENSSAALERVIAEKKGNVQVQGHGTVTRILPDDTRGSKHQRFIVNIPSGQTLLISHNIDLAPGIHSLRTGDSVEFSGEFEWNPQGGVIHWTHHDPAGRHVPGWIIHNGKRYD